MHLFDRMRVLKKEEEEIDVIRLKCIELIYSPRTVHDKMQSIR